MEFKFNKTISFFDSFQHLQKIILLLDKTNKQLKNDLGNIYYLILFLLIFQILIPFISFKFYLFIYFFFFRNFYGNYIFFIY